MPVNPQADRIFVSPDAPPSTFAPGSRRARRKSSLIAYSFGVCLLACVLFLALRWLLGAGESNEGTLTAAFAALSVIFLGVIARDRLLSARAHAARRRPVGNTAWQSNSAPIPTAVSGKIAALNLLERRVIEINAQANTPEKHLSAYRLCEEYVAGANESLTNFALAPATRQSLHAKLERVRVWQKHHLLSWAREGSQKLIYRAQRRARASAKIETAQKASEIIQTALRAYPHEQQLHDSVEAIREYIATARVEYWMELAERAAFKGSYRHAVDRYRNALFYLDHDKVWGKSRTELEERIHRQVQSLQTILSLSEESDEATFPGAES